MLGCIIHRATSTLESMDHGLLAMSQILRPPSRSVKLPDHKMTSSLLVRLGGPAISLDNIEHCV